MDARLIFLCLVPLMFAPAISGDSRGQLFNCGDAAHNFTFQWEPANINFDLQHDVTVYFDYTPLHDWDHGKACYTVHMEPYEDPIYEGCTEDSSCDVLERFLPGVCPFKKGKRIKIDGMKVPFKTEITIPSTVFRVRLELYSDSEMMLCAKGRVKIVE